MEWDAFIIARPIGEKDGDDCGAESLEFLNVRELYNRRMSPFHTTPHAATRYNDADTARAVAATIGDGVIVVRARTNVVVHFDDD